MPSSHSYVEAPRLNKVIRVGPRSYRISVLIRRDTRELALSLIVTVPLHTTHNSDEHTDRRQPSASIPSLQQEKPHQKPILPLP